MAFLGNTGVGKSTMINFLAGKQLKPDAFCQAYQLVDSEDISAMKIGMGSDSETIYPQWLEINGILYFDLPGFSDSNGSIRDLVNAAFIREILVNAASVRLVFVMGFDEVTSQRGKVMKHFFSAIRNVFPSTSVIEESSVLVLTKSSFLFREIEMMNQFLATKVKSSNPGNDLTGLFRVWEANERITHVPHPKFDDISNQQEIRAIIQKKIEEITAAKQEDVQRLNLSGFYPSEIHYSLQKMFVHIYTVLTPEFQQNIAENIQNLEQLKQKESYVEASSSQ